MCKAFAQTQFCVFMYFYLVCFKFLPFLYLAHFLTKQSVTLHSMTTLLASYMQEHRSVQLHEKQLKCVHFTSPLFKKQLILFLVHSVFQLIRKMFSKAKQLDCESMCLSGDTYLPSRQLLLEWVEFIAINIPQLNILTFHVTLGLSLIHI